jgi:hypothetical protein
MRLTHDQHAVLCEMYGSERAWCRPMDIGGRDGSRQSGVLAQLERKGLHESRQRSPHPARGAKVYRLTPSGTETAIAFTTPARRDRAEQAAAHSEGNPR